jgi:hypothetical protein
MRIRGSILIVFFVLSALLFWRVQGHRNAEIGDAVLPSPTVFPEPSPIVWDGKVLRSLAGRRGLEIKSESVPGGYFFAYSDDGFPESFSSSFLRVQGLWIGISCEYGRCAPEVNVKSFEEKKNTP